VLLGLVIEKLTGERLEVAFEKRIFRPLGLAGTLLPSRESSAIPDPHPHAYHFGTFAETQMAQGGKLPPEQLAAAQSGTLRRNDGTYVNPSMAWAAGGVISTAPQLARYVKAMVGGSLLSPAWQERRLQSLRTISPDRQDYGYGYNLDNFGPMYGHEGDMPGGFTSTMYHDPHRDITVITWTSLADFAPTGVDPADAALKVIFPELYPGLPVPRM
jgi:D-alanyl-D-alanine carboxypeptidase